MTKSQKHALRLSEIRSKLNALGGKDSLSDEERAELDSLTNEYGDVEARWRAATVAEQSDGQDTKGEEQDGEAKELGKLEARASVGEVFDAAVEQRATEGATKELQDELGLAGNSVPLALLRGEQPAVEVRTAGVTPAPGDVGQSSRPIIPAVFPQAAVSWLGLRQDTVGVGEAVYTVLSTSSAPGTPAKGAEQDHSAAGFSAKVLSPSRIQASLFYAREDRARLAGLDAALRRNLSDALADKLDEEVLDNLLTGSTLTQQDAGAADTYASYRKRFLYDRIDGTYAGGAGDLRLLVGAATYGDMAASYRSNSSDMNALGAILAEAGGVRVSAHAPAVASHKQAGLVRRGNRQDYAVGIWEGVSIIVDEVSQAKAGEIILTAVMLHAKSLLRADGFAKVEAQHQ